MLDFIQQNAGSIAVGVMLLAAVAVIIVHLILDKRSGKCSCGGNCGACGACGHCTGCNDNDKNKTKPQK